MMIEHIGSVLELGKVFRDIFSWKEAPKLVNNDWLSKSGLQGDLAMKGFGLYWCPPEKLESKKLDGFEIVYHADKKSRTRWILKDSSEAILMKRSKTRL